VPLAVISDAFDLRKAGDVSSLVALIKEQEEAFGLPCSLVVVDTLNKAMPGADENASADHSIAHANVDRIRRDTGATVLLLHHNSKYGQGPRGHSSLTGSADTQIFVEKTNNDARHRLFIEKQRDDKTDQEIKFRLRRIELARDVDGDPISSCTVEWLTASEFDRHGVERCCHRNVGSVRTSGQRAMRRE
jgi:hypothetical protein